MFAITVHSFKDAELAHCLKIHEKPWLHITRSKGTCVYIKHVKRSLIDCIQISSSNDKTCFLQNKGKEIMLARDSNKSKIAWKALRTLLAFGGKKSKFSRAVQALKDASDQPITDPVSIDNAKLEHFGSVECSNFVSLDQLIDNGNGTTTALPECLDIKSVPNISNVNAYFRGAKKGVTPGIDNISNDVHSTAPLPIARLYAPLYAKMALLVREPLSFKGGLITSFLKGDGYAADLISSQRNILLGIGACKGYHKIVRKRIEPALGEYAGETQCGGILSRSTDFATHTVRLFFEWAAMPIHVHDATVCKSSVSAACVFYDLSDAFYTMISQLVSDTPNASQVIHKVTEKLNLSEDEQLALRVLTQEAGELEKAGISEHDRAIIVEAFRSRWSVTQHSDKVAIPFTGCQPGMPLADILFNFCFAGLLKEIRAKATAASLFVEVPCNHSRDIDARPNSSTNLIDVSYVDDGCYILTHHIPNQLISNVAALCTIIHNACRNRGFQPNYKVGKSAVLLELRGKGAPDAKRRVYIEHDMKIFFGTESQLSINVTRRYKHLGGLQPNIGSEIKHRARGHATAIGPLKKVVFRHSDLDRDSKKIFASALANTKLWYNAATWPKLTEAQHISLDQSIMKCIAPMSGKQWKTKDVRTSYAAICAEVEEPLSDIKLRVSRLEYLGRLQKHAPPQLIALLQATAQSKNAYTSLVQNDLTWMHEHCSKAADACGSKHPLAFWSHFASEFENTWKKYVSIARKNAIRMQNDKLHLESWSRNLDRILPGVGSDLPEQSAQSEQNYMCECGEILETQSAWRKHLSKAHGWRHPTFDYTRGTVCEVCGTEFHTRRRLALHWRTTKDCFRVIASNTLPLTPDECVEADKQEALQSKHAASFGRGMHFAEKPAHSTEDQLVRFLTADQCNIDEETPGYPHVTIVPAADVQQPLQCMPPKPFGTGTLFVINLFSGQRRVNDIQQQFETLIADKYNVRILSVDIINDPKLGNLLNEDTIALWMSLFSARAIIGLACGPPCETFAAIRHCPLADGKPGPPPLRSLDFIWGLPSLSHKHGIQVSVANRLYRTCILLISKAKQIGAFGVLEHPDLAAWQPLHPSSWLINQTKSIVSLLHAETTQIDQCSCGTDYRKPTRLLHVNLPSLPLRIARLPGGGRCTHRKHAKVLRGVNSEGKFRTAPAKEYPAEFCKLIASAMHDFVVLYLSSGTCSRKRMNSARS